MPILTAAIVYADNGTTVDTGTGIDVRRLNAANPAAANDTQTAAFTHTNDNVERTFDPANAGVTNTNHAGTTLFRCGYAFRLAEDSTPTDDTNCNAFLPAQTLTVNVWSSANQSGGTYVSGTYGPTMRASLWRYNPATDAGVLIAAGSDTSQTWAVTALNVFKNSPIAITVPATEILQGEILLLQVGFNTGTVPNPTLGTANWVHTMRVADPTNPTRINFVTGLRTLCASTGSSSASATVAGVSGLVKPGAGSAAGVATVAGVSGATKGSTGSSAGAATVAGVSAAVKGGTGSSAGIANVDGKAASVKGGTGTVVVSSGGGGGTTIAPVFPIFDA
ncbi:MAG TPA: hypothetical protein VFZ38_10630 [Vicinamibacterales bacterium]